MTQRVLDELGFYLLAGAGGDGPATLMDEARRGEELGFGTGFISERWNVKEASSLTGAACAVTNRMHRRGKRIFHPIVRGLENQFVAAKRKIRFGILPPECELLDIGEVPLGGGRWRHCGF